MSTPRAAPGSRQPMPVRIAIIAAAVLAIATLAPTLHPAWAAALGTAGPAGSGLALSLEYAAMATLALALAALLTHAWTRLARRSPRMAERWARARRMPRDQAVQELGDGATYLKLMQKQLVGATQEAEKGAQDLVERLRGIHQVSATQFDRIQSSEASGLELTRVMKEKVMIDAQLGSILEMFAQKQEADVRENLERIQRLQGVKSLAPLVDVIATVARQTNFLSINAAIEAARAGESGRGFAVVAAEIRQLSNRTAEVAVDIAQKISIATEGVDQELAAAEQSGDRQSTAGNMRRVLTDVATMQQRFAESVEGMDRVLQDVRSGHQDLASHVADTLGLLQMQDVTRQRLEAVQRAMDDLTEHLRRTSGQLLEEPWDPDAMNKLRERMQSHASHYVMHSQRVTHQNVTGQPVGDLADQPRIELF